MAEFWQALIDNSGAVVAVFTVVLAVTTITYVVVSVKLLKQSRNAFLADMVLRIMEICRRELTDIGGDKETIKKRNDELKAWVKGYRVAFIKVDKKVGINFEEFLIAGLEAMRKKQRDLKRPKND